MEFRVHHQWRYDRIDEWQSKWNVQVVAPVTDEEGNAHPYFSHYPLFSLPTEVEDCEILYTNDNI